MQTNHQESPAQMIGREDTAKLANASMRSIYRWAHEGRFPAPLKIGPRRIAWRKAEVEAWLSNLPVACAKKGGAA